METLVSHSRKKRQRQVRCIIMVNISACHAGHPGSILRGGVFRVEAGGKSLQIIADVCVCHMFMAANT